MHDHTALFLANLLISGATAWVALCRLNAMSHQTHATIRAQFVLLVMGATANGLYQTPGFGSLALCTAVLVFLLLSSPRWREGAPPDTTRPAPLDAIE